MKFDSTWRVASHTDNVGSGSIYVAIKGFEHNGADYIKMAIEKGAKKIVIESDLLISESLKRLIEENSVQVVRVDDTRKALAELSSKAYGYPSKSLKIIGITGTKGKTTTAYVLEKILKTAGYKTALLSSIKNKILDYEFSYDLTTPKSDYLNVFFDVCRKNKVDYVVMEVAAQALTLDRVYGIEFDGAIFSNFALEHLEFYKNLNEYFFAKIKLFDRLKKNASKIVNIDDEKIFSFVLSNQEKRNWIKFGLASKSDIYAQIIENNISGLKIKINFKNKSYIINSKLVGKFNVYNILAAVSFAHSIDLDCTLIQKALKKFGNLPGRFERFYLKNGSLAVIDFAHNPLSFESILLTLKQVNKKLIVVFGAGGERDESRRPIMGSIAANYADKIVLSDDNPRSEDPKKIINDIIYGIPEKNISKVIIERNREKAIEMAYKFSDSETIIAILGKGNDQYQLIGSDKKCFNERLILSKFQ